MLKKLQNHIDSIAFCGAKREKKVENMDDESIACFGGSIHQLGRDMRYNGEALWCF